MSSPGRAIPSRLFDPAVAEPGAVVRPWCTAPISGQIPRPSSGCHATLQVSVGEDGLERITDRRSKRRIEHSARQLHLDSLSVEASTSHSTTDDRLVSEDGILDQLEQLSQRPEEALGYRDFAYLYWLRFGYLTGAHSRVRGFASP